MLLDHIFSYPQDSNIDIYQKMWQHMSTASPPSLVSSYEEGVRRVLAGNYAFLMESTMLDHRVQRDCNLTQIGGLLDSKVFEEFETEIGSGRLFEDLIRG